ncbi:Putative concanavalin A-like lectin/glucanase domain superfamily, glycoside hydrolase superfamily [Colletotrichum destructivum]|uniref:beta-N-acetylhexosaminidase n=1 Tax=Colletotrichum destructivum TaxID=34406 RepID=A0AAX4J3I3_9PEZI|nr:Putative concanavalin A-like lectin/glucanase domain superfamily, glycoside hydrolase superfamily [Colletotrichum destructivum]
MRFTPILAFLASKAVADSLPGLPTAPYTPTGGTLPSASLTRIIVSSEFAEFVDDAGQTLIPPTLHSFATTFASDLASVVGLDIPVELGATAEQGSIFLTLGDASLYKDAAGRETSEGYSLNVTVDGVLISGASPLGVWWGTRTLLQQLVLDGGEVKLGYGVDSPGWGIRGMMLDIARHYYPPDFLVEMCAYMSFFKQNTFQLHLSDNLYNNVAIYSRERSLSLYAAFRLLSDDPALEGLNRRANESYTRDVFDDIQARCAARGVTVLPEIETPGHALVITQWKPELGLQSDLSLLNISNPETIPVVKKIWDTFLPWFHTKTVSIGADEYVDPTLSEEALVGEYTRFVDEMNEHITSTSGKHVRIWGTFAPSVGGSVNKSVSIQHWANFEANPLYDFVNNGYDVLNSGEYIYTVGKWSQWYGSTLSLDFIFHGSPDGSAFAPNIFDRENATNNAAMDSPSLLGHIAPQWNDYGPNATTVTEGYYQWRDGLPALADKQWGGDVAEADYPGLFAALQPLVPGQNLDRRVASKGSTILEYDFKQGRGSNGTVQDLSGNQYHATSTCVASDEGAILTPSCHIKTPLDQKGRNYTLSFSIKPTSDAKGAIFSGGDSGLWFGNGTVSAVMLFSGESTYALNYTFPVGSWTNASLIGRGRQTFLDVGAGEPMEFLTVMGWNGDRFVWAPIAVEAPLATVGGSGFEGVIGGMKLVDDA